MRGERDKREEVRESKRGKMRGGQDSRSGQN